MRLRHVLVCFGLLAVLAAPTAAFAQGGGSAGNQQYTDPFASTTQTSTHAQTTTSPPVTTPAATSPAPAVTPTTPTISAAAATTPVATDATSGGKTLPYTGLDLWTVVGVGLALTASGLLIRVGSRRA